MYNNWCGYYRFCTHASICCHTFPVSFYVHNNDSNSSIAVSLRQ